MADSLVLQLQELASGTDTQVPELLRKSLVVATKLSLKEFRTWVELELNGYRDSDVPVPPYRNARAQIKLHNPYHGLVPLVIQDKRIADAVQNVVIHDPIGNLVHLLERGEDGDGYLIYALPDQLTMLLMEGQSGYVPLPPVRLISSGQIAVVVDAVRTKILDWSLELEANGIMGDGMRFTQEEKQRAAVNSSINIKNFQGILGNVHGQNKIIQNLSQEIHRGDFDSLARYLRSIRIDEVDIGELRSIIQDEPTLTNGSLRPRTSGWLGKMLTKAAQGTWDVSVEVAGNLISAAILAFHGVAG